MPIIFEKMLLFLIKNDQDTTISNMQTCEFKGYDLSLFLLSCLAHYFNSSKNCGS